MGRNHLAHASGDAINAVLAAAGYNFRRLLAWLRLLLLRTLIVLSLPAELKSGSSRPTNQTVLGASRPRRS
jgi:transposase, IS5 family